MIKVIGIDPGLSATGFGIARGTNLNIDSFAFGSINTSKTLSLPNRLDRIFTEMLRMLKAETPDLMVVEDVFSVPKFPKAGITLSKVTGVALLAGCRQNVPVIEVSVREAKQVLTGNGNATKTQLEKAVRRLLNLKNTIRPYHASDAMGLALLGLFRYTVQRPEASADLTREIKKNDRLSGRQIIKKRR